jgi:hypothetical protein
MTWEMNQSNDIRINEEMGSYVPLFVWSFESMEDFKYWLHRGTVHEIDQCRKIFEHFELYEHCQACVDVIKEKDIFGILNGIGAGKTGDG